MPFCWGLSNFAFIIDTHSLTQQNTLKACTGAGLMYESQWWTNQGLNFHHFKNDEIY